MQLAVADNYQTMIELLPGWSNAIYPTPQDGSLAPKSTSGRSCLSAPFWSRKTTSKPILN